MGGLISSTQVQEKTHTDSVVPRITEIEANLLVKFASLDACDIGFEFPGVINETTPTC